MKSNMKGKIIFNLVFCISLMMISFSIMIVSFTYYEKQINDMQKQAESNAWEQISEMSDVNLDNIMRGE